MVKKAVKKTTTKYKVNKPVMAVVETKKDITSYYQPVLVILLLVAAFYIGRLSAQVESLKGGTAGAGEIIQADPEAAAERKLDVPSLKARAKSLGLNTSEFDQCLDGAKYGQRVLDEQAEGTKLGVSGTPTFFINGIMMVGALPQSSFESVIEAELKDGTGDKAAAALGESGTRNKLSLAKSYVRGAENAKIKIVEFTDFECPFCERAFPTIATLEDKYKGKISLEYKSFPLSFHANAQKAAEAALCAGDQGKFWEMHDNLFVSAQ